MYSFGLIILIIGYVEATCTGDRPIKPVCGSDGGLYYNECHMKDEVLAQKLPYPVYPVPWEQCAEANCDELCFRDFNPVCGSDGEISGNPCSFLWYHVCENKKYVYEVDMEFCLTKKCPHNCATNDEKCIHAWKVCRYEWAGYSP